MKSRRIQIVRLNLLGFHIIGLTFGNLNKLASDWKSTHLNRIEFMEKFKAELTALEKQVMIIGRV